MLGRRDRDLELTAGIDAELIERALAEHAVLLLVHVAVVQREDRLRSPVTFARTR
jgi:hypothetical protein